MDQLPSLLEALILAGILWVIRSQMETQKSMAVLESKIATSILPELARLRESGHHIRDIAQAALSKGELLQRDVDALWEGDERRTGSDRRKREGPRED